MSNFDSDEGERMMMLLAELFVLETLAQEAGEEIVTDLPEIGVSNMRLQDDKKALVTRVRAAWHAERN